MLYLTDDQPADELTPTSAQGSTATDEPALAAAVRSLRALIMAGERYRLTVAGLLGLGTTETQALSYLAVHGARGQSELARDLSLTSSAATALVDRLERHGAAERARHPSDRRRTLIRLTVHGEELAAAYASADVLAFPSTTETLGLVALESLASGVPVVGAWAGGIPFAVADGRTGLLVPPGDADALTAGLARLLDDAALRARMGAAGRAEAEGLGWRAATEFLVASYEEAVRRHRSRRPAPRHPRG